MLAKLLVEFRFGSFYRFPFKLANKNVEDGQTKDCHYHLVNEQFQQNGAWMPGSFRSNIL